MATARMMGMRASWFGMAMAGVLAFMLLPSLAKGFLMGQGFTYTPVINPVISSGHVMARAQVVGPNGGPILVKVRSSGAGGQSSTVEVEEIGEAYAGGPLEGVYVLSGSAYRDVLRQLAQLRARYPERMARAEFLPAQQLASGLSLADGSSSPGVTLPDHIKTVVVWGRQDRLSPETDAHILLSAPFQLDAGTSLAEDVSSLLMNPDGSIRSLAHGSGVGGDSFDVESFTWRTAFYSQPGSTEQSDRRVDRNEDTIFGPISNAILEQIGWFGTMYAVTDADGYYFINSPMLCMRNSYGGYLLPGMDTNLILTVPTVPFNPNRLGIPPYFEIRDIYAGCSDSFYPYRINFMIDVLWLVGELHLSNTPGGAAIPVGSNVSYEGQDRSGEPTVRVWDYDGDGEPDTAILANKVTVTDPETGESFIIAEAASDGPYQAVYFSSGTRDQNAEQLADRVPDLWRLADRTLDGRPTGLLTEISEDALRHTDVYIFRESTGELLVEVSGLPEGPYAGRASRIENNAYLWHTLLRGRESVRNNFAAYGTPSGSLSPANEDAFRERSAELGFSSRYQSRDADMPAPGEMLHVVAINRVTGYTGSVRFELGTANSPGGAQQRVPRLELLPPNVKVWAQRLTEIEAGLTAGEQREYLISHEGAHTANDLIVGLYTDWRAADGSPLPNALGQLRGADFGLTGRLAKVRDGQLVPVTAGQALDSSITLEDALAAGSQGAVAEFPIGPGQNLQLLRLPNAESGGNEHYYVNLFGRALNKEVCSHCQYDQAGMHPTLAGRPNHFAPVFVPRYDQARTDALRRAAQELAEQGEENEEAIKVDAQYLWMLRPEYQFSQIDLAVGHIDAGWIGQDGDEYLRNLLHLESPVITSGDNLINVLYSLIVPGYEKIPGFDGQNGKYVVTIAGEEIGLVSGEGLTLSGNWLSRIQDASIEELLTLRIYLNGDSENTLWEWAFEYIDFSPKLIPEGGGVRARVLLGRNTDIAKLAPENMPSITIGEKPCGNVRQSASDPRAFYCSPPDIRGDGTHDVTISNIIVPGFHALEYGLPFKAENLTGYITDAYNGLKYFSESVGIFIEEAEDIAVEESVKGSGDALGIFEAAINSALNNAVSSVGEFLRGKEVGVDSAFVAEEMVRANSQVVEDTMMRLGALDDWAIESGGTANNGVNIYAVGREFYPVPTISDFFVISRFPFYDEVSIGIEVELVELSEETGEEIRFIKIGDDEIELESGEDLLAFGIDFGLPPFSHDNYYVRVSLIDGDGYYLGSYRYADVDAYVYDATVFSEGTSGEDRKGVYRVGALGYGESSVNVGALFRPAYAFGQLYMDLRNLPSLGDETFFEDVKSWSRISGKDIYVGTRWAYRYAVVDMDQREMAPYTISEGGKKIDDVIQANKSYRLIINGALFNATNRDGVPDAPFVTTGIIYRDGEVMPTSADPGAHPYSFNLAGQRFWVGQNSGSMEFGAGHPTPMDAAVGGLISAIWPEAGGSVGRPVLPEDDADLRTYEGIGGQRENHGFGIAVYRALKGRATGQAILGYDADSNMLLLVAKSPYVLGDLLAMVEEMHSSGVDRALILDGGSSVAFSVDQEVRVRGNRHRGVPSDSQTVTNYIMVR